MTGRNAAKRWIRGHLIRIMGQWVRIKIIKYDNYSL